MSLKIHSRSRPAKRPRPEGVKPLKLMTLTHFQLFLKRPRAPKNVSKLMLKWSLWALKITKIQKREHSKKTAKPRPWKRRSRLALGGGPRMPFLRLFGRKTHNSPRNPQNGPQGQPGPSKMTKNHDFDSQHLENPLRIARFLHSCSQHFLTTCLRKNLLNIWSCKQNRRPKQTKKWLGGGLCTGPR